MPTTPSRSSSYRCKADCHECPGPALMDKLSRIKNSPITHDVLFECAGTTERLFLSSLSRR